jgi:hypothetical protein
MRISKVLATIPAHRGRKLVIKEFQYTGIGHWIELRQADDARLSHGDAALRNVVKIDLDDQGLALDELISQLIALRTFYVRGTHIGNGRVPLPVRA